jgi:glycosyl transferase family 25
MYLIIILFLIILFKKNRLGVLNKYIKIYKGTIIPVNGNIIDIRNIKIYVINLARSVGRRNHIKKILGNLNYEFVNAVNGKDLDSKYVNDIKKNTLRNLSVGEIGCFLSHKKVYKKILDSSEDYCLILEDDIQLCKNFVNEINKCLSQINNFDIFYCFNVPLYQFYNTIGDDVKNYFPEKWNKNLPLLLDQNYSKDCVLATGPRLLTHAMIISKKAAKQLLGNMSIIKVQIDWQINFKNVREGLKIYGSKKNLIYQWHQEFKSTIR